MAGATSTESAIIQRYIRMYFCDDMCIYGSWLPQRYKTMQLGERLILESRVHDRLVGMFEEWQLEFGECISVHFEVFRSHFEDS